MLDTTSIKDDQSAFQARSSAAISHTDHEMDKKGGEYISRNINQVDSKYTTEPMNDFSGTSNLQMVLMAKYIGEEQVGLFIKKALKIYKGLRVLERNKKSDTPMYSRSMEKLIRFFSKKFPENCGLEGNLSDLVLNFSNKS